LDSNAIIYYLSVPDPQVALDRVRLRVIEGGHNVPDAVVIRRFHQGRLNFDRIYKPLADKWVLFDNTSRRPVVMEEYS
jgi:predicted ABC-type ATPase